CGRGRPTTSNFTPRPRESCGLRRLSFGNSAWRCSSGASEKGILGMGFVVIFRLFSDLAIPGLGYYGNCQLTMFLFKAPTLLVNPQLENYILLKRKVGWLPSIGAAEEAGSGKGPQ